LVFDADIGAHFQNSSRRGYPVDYRNAWNAVIDRGDTQINATLWLPS
jgi:hypothetical protein